MKNWLNSLSVGGKVILLIVICGLFYAGWWAYGKLFPEKLKITEVKTKATGLPPLAYDKSANAAFRKLPEFNEPVDIQAPEIRGAIMGWNGFASGNYAVGGTSTSKGSICEELGLNVHLSVQNSCNEQGNQLYAFAGALHNGEANPSQGVHFVNWMGDGGPAYLAGLNDRIIKDFGPEYVAEVVTFTGASFGEDKWLLKSKYAKDARGSVTATVVMDGDWNIAMIKCQLMGWPVNHALGTYDKSKVNFVDAPNGDYIEAGKMYTTGAKVTLRIVENGKYTGRDTTLTVTGVASWFPVDQQVVQGKGGLLTVASTKDFGAQMGCAIVMIKKWVDDNRPLVEKLIEAFGRAGDQVKSHDEALRFASQVSEIVFADKEKSADDWYNAYKSFDLTDDDGNVVNIGGSRAFSLADAATYVGITGGTDKYKQIYSTFANIDMEAYPERINKMYDYAIVTDWSFLRNVYNRNKSAGTEGSVSKIDFVSAQKGGVVGDASYSIQFNTGSATIKPESYPVLDKIVGQLNVADNTFVEIAGHTDNVGDDVSNLTLSERRAQSVREYLISKDADLNSPKRLNHKGYGEAMPLPGTTSADPRNRRVEIKLFKAK